MGSGDWIKNIIKQKKVKDEKSKKLKESASEKSNGNKEEHQPQKESPKIAKGVSARKQRVPVVLTEDIAATRIQTAFRAYMARKTFRRLKGITKFQAFIQGHSGKKQASSTLSYLHSWSKIQAHIRSRRVHMVTEGRLRQKKLENQLQVEAKLHDLEVEWNGGSETMEEVLARIHLREEAAVKRERALAYAYSHQWRANSNPLYDGGDQELGKTNWGWSWMDRWIAARPWESRIPNHSTPKKPLGRQASKKGSKSINSPKTKTPISVKSNSPVGKMAVKARKLSFEPAEKVVPQKGGKKIEEAGAKKTLVQVEK